MGPRLLWVGGMMTECYFQQQQALGQPGNIKLHPQVRNFYQQMTFSESNKKGVTAIVIAQLIKASKTRRERCQWNRYSW